MRHRVPTRPRRVTMLIPTHGRSLISKPGLRRRMKWSERGDDEGTNGYIGDGSVEPRATGWAEPRSTVLVEPRSTGQVERRATVLVERRATGQVERRATVLVERRATGRI